MIESQARVRTSTAVADIGVDTRPDDSVRLTLPTQRHRPPAVTAVVRVVGVDAQDPERTGAAVLAAADLTDAGEVLVVNLTRNLPTGPDLNRVVSRCAEALAARGAVLVVAGTGRTTSGVPVRPTVAEAAESAMAGLSTLA